MRELEVGESHYFPILRRFDVQNSVLRCRQQVERALAREKWSFRERRGDNKKIAPCGSAREGRKKYLKFSTEVLSSFRPAGSPAREAWMGTMRSRDFKKGRLENAALSLWETPRIAVGSPSLRYTCREQTRWIIVVHPSPDLESPITKESRPGISFAIISSRARTILHPAIVNGSCVRDKKWGVWHNAKFIRDERK